MKGALWLANRSKVLNAYLAEMIKEGLESIEGYDKERDIPGYQ